MTGKRSVQPLDRELRPVLQRHTGADQPFEARVMRPAFLLDGMADFGSGGGEQPGCLMVRAVEAADAEIIQGRNGEVVGLAIDSIAQGGDLGLETVIHRDLRRAGDAFDPRIHGWCQHGSCRCTPVARNPSGR